MKGKLRRGRKRDKRVERVERRCRLVV